MSGALWVPGWPVRALPYLGQRFTPSALVDHRTIGHWAGDLTVLSRGRVPSVTWLIGEEPGQRVQFYPADRTIAGAAGANGYAFQAEYSGANGSTLTGWQKQCHAELLTFGRDEWGINPASHLGEGDGRVAWWAGVLNHLNVLTTPEYTHFDYVNDADYQSGALAPDDTEEGDADMFLGTIDGQSFYLFVWRKGVRAVSSAFASFYRGPRGLVKDQAEFDSLAALCA